MSGATTTSTTTTSTTTTTPAVLDRVTPVGEGEVVIRGALRTSVDGSVFDAVTQQDAYPGLAGAAGLRLGGLYDLAAGGLRVVAQDTGAHVYRLAAAAGAPGRACAEAGVATPCLVPRLAALAHERLITAGELAATLGGRVEVEMIEPPAPPLLTRAETETAAGVLGLAGALAAAALVRAWARRRRVTPMGEVRAAARVARRAAGRSRMLAPVRAQIAELVARARDLEHARRACARQLRRVDRAAIEARRAAPATAADPLLAAEAAEADRLAADLAASASGLARIASALRLVPLRVREHRGTEIESARWNGDPVNLLLSELDGRDAALAETEHVVLRR